MSKLFRFTVKRKQALRKAQLASARKRKGKGKGKNLFRNVAIGVTGVTAAAVVTGSAAYTRHKLSGSQFVQINGKREPTIMTTVAGVPVPGVRSGFIHSEFGKKEGFAIRYVHRNKDGDKTIFNYRHHPLTMQAIKSAFGGKIGGGPETVTQFKPTSATHKVDEQIMQEINRKAFTNERGMVDQKAKRKIMKHPIKSSAEIFPTKTIGGTPIGKTKNGDIIRRGGHVVKDGKHAHVAVAGSRAAALLWKRKISVAESMRRTNEYQRRMTAKGITLSQSDLASIRALFGKEVY